MTFKQKYRENQKLIILYNDFLKKEPLDFNNRLQLIAEIGRLYNQNLQIQDMPVKDFESDTLDYIILETSRL